MKAGLGQKYMVNTFEGGMINDVNLVMPSGEVRNVYVANTFFDLYHEAINILKAGQGIATLFGGPISNASLTFIGAIYYESYVYHFWAKSGETYIYRGYTLIGQSEDLPGSDGSFLYMDIDQNTGEIAITDRTKVPVILDLADMYDKRLTDTYMADYDSSIYEINPKIPLTPPVFQNLVSVVGGGLNIGSYSYSVRMGNVSGDKTPWSSPTPFIPVPKGYGTVTPDLSKAVNPGAKTYGEESSLSPSNYGILLAIRMVNYIGFDYVEIKRIANNTGAPTSYTPNAEYYVLPNSIESTHTVIGFTDSAAIAWAPLADDDDVRTSAISTADTVRFYSDRLVLGGVTYQSRVIDDDSIFLDIVTGKQGIPFKEDLGIEGYTDIDNQVYKKSVRLGERYSYGIQVTDTSANKQYAIPIPDLVNYKLPERREAIPSAEQIYSPDAPEVPTIESNQGSGYNDDTYEVFIQGEENKSQVPTGIPPAANVVVLPSDTAGYEPMTPTSRDGVKNYDYYRLSPVYRIKDAAASFHIHNPKIFGPHILATGMKLGGIDVSAMPSWAGGISVLRTEAAGRVVAQGLGMYALYEVTGGVAKKHLDRIWAYFPELDSVIGDKAAIYEDFKNNPGDYEIQLVSPVGFATEVFNALENAAGTSGKVDMVSYANAYYGGGGDSIGVSDPSGIVPVDDDADVGEGDGLITFGKWRNSVVGTLVSGEGSPYEYIFGVTSVDDASANLAGKAGRAEYLEITLEDDIYAEDEFTQVEADAAAARAGHEPWYIINLVKRDAQVSEDNSTPYKELGHYIPLASEIGISLGASREYYAIVAERLGDVRALNFSVGSDETYRYVWVNGQRWLDVTDDSYLRQAALAYTAAEYTAGVAGLCPYTIYGVYEVVSTRSIIRGGSKAGYYVRFGLESTDDASIIHPNEGDTIEIRYDENEPIDVFLGDTIIAETGFTPIDCSAGEWTTSLFSFSDLFRLDVPMPYRSFQSNPLIYMPDDVASSTESDRIQSDAAVERAMSYIRQWMVSFICETSVNIPLMHKNFWPHVNYILRPNIYDELSDTETPEEYLESLNMYAEYERDYPGEYLLWEYGGFKTPQGYNFDYNKRHSDRFSSLPESGIVEILEYPKRLVWSVSKPSSLASADKGVKIFPITNYYDLKHNRSSEINILYDAYTSKGSNLYVITDSGVCLVMIDKALIRDGVSNLLGIAVQDSGFIGGEHWINSDHGCPDNLFRGRTEDIIVTANNLTIPILVFPSYSKILMLAEDNIVDLSKGRRSVIKSLLNAMTDAIPISMAVNRKTNSLWVLIGNKLMSYGFDADRWVKENSLSASNYVKSILSSKEFSGSVRDRVQMIEYKSGAISLKYTSDTVVTESIDGSVPSISFIVSPGTDEYEFIDMLIKSSTKPDYITLQDVGGTYSVTVQDTDMKDYGNGKYYFLIPRSSGNKKMMFDALYVTVVYDRTVLTSSSLLYYVKTGYLPVS